MQDLLKLADLHPVLVDVGASGGAPLIWKPIASRSIYIAFDPDLRDMAQSHGGEFYRRVVFNKALTDDPLQTEVEFNLTAHPHCSSTLKPDLTALSNYAFHEYFVTDRTVRAPAITFSAVIEQAGFDHVDWIKIDTQGTDLRLLRSLPTPVQSRILAIDIEPGLMDAYQGEDLFVDVHRYLMQNGYWLSNLRIGGASRIKTSTLAEVAPDPMVRRAVARKRIKESPAWTEARYLRRVETVTNRNDCVLLWVFATLDEQYGFALDVALEYERRFGNDACLEIMNRESRDRLRVPAWYGLAARLKKLLKK